MGPWCILELLHGGLYSLQHFLHPKRTDKKHASDLTPYSPELVPFKPVDGADTRYGQLYHPIGKHPFKEAGLKGFTPPAPFQVANLFVDIGDFEDFVGRPYWNLMMSWTCTPGGMTLNATVS